jgi:diguanylate cyclase (GGDEF)-like protein
VLVATSGEPALALARDKAPDAVLLDVTLPGIDGFEACRRLKTDALTRDIPVIFITSHDDLDIEAHGLDCGAVDFITKPIHPRILLARVKVHVMLKQRTDLLLGLAYIDGLTGLCNRRGFDERLTMEWQRAQRSGQWLTLMLIDVDHFKHYNDHHGHQAGDDCLRAIAGALVEAARRPADLVARYGGEEFAVILPETGAEEASAMVQRLQAKVRELTLPHGAEAAAPIVTVSIGVAVARGRPRASRRAHRRADRQLRPRAVPRQGSRTNAAGGAARPRAVCASAAGVRNVAARRPVAALSAMRTDSERPSSDVRCSVLPGRNRSFDRCTRSWSWSSCG